MTISSINWSNWKRTLSLPLEDSLMMKPPGRISKNSIINSTKPVSVLKRTKKKAFFVKKKKEKEPTRTQNDFLKRHFGSFIYYFFLLLLFYRVLPFTVNKVWPRIFLIRLFFLFLSFFFWIVRFRSGLERIRSRFSFVFSFFWLFFFNPIWSCCNRIEPDFQPFYWVLLGFIGFYWILFRIPRCYRRLYQI